LARLELTDAEIEKMQKDMSEILGYFDLLKKVPKIKIRSTKSEIRNLRKDEVVSSYDIRDELIATAPDKKDDYIKVKNIF
jgi:aspartyl/glutamyl-tRNA(Asn/Gln) amidotransferase C subunit